MSGIRQLLRKTALTSIVLLIVFVAKPSLVAEPVTVRYKQTALHNAFVLRSDQGKQLATGELSQTVSGDRVTAHLIFHFTDGSIDDDITVYDQAGTLRFISGHHVQKGPSFTIPMDMTIDAAAGTVTSRDASGKQSVDRMQIPPDLSNGILPVMLESISPQAQQTTVSYLAATPKPRLLKFLITPAAPQTTNGRTVQPYVIKVQIGGVVGLLAPIAGKQPPDFHADVVPGNPPHLIKLQVQLFFDGPLWTIEHANVSSR